MIDTINEGRSSLRTITTDSNATGWNAGLVRLAAISSKTPQAALLALVKAHSAAAARPKPKASAIMKAGDSNSDTDSSASGATRMRPVRFRSVRSRQNTPADMAPVCNRISNLGDTEASPVATNG